MFHFLSLSTSWASRKFAKVPAKCRQFKVFLKKDSQEILSGSTTLGVQIGGFILGMTLDLPFSVEPHLKVFSVAAKNKKEAQPKFDLAPPSLLPSILIVL